jgi:hypothetical protein
LGKAKRFATESTEKTEVRHVRQPSTPHGLAFLPVLFYNRGAPCLPSPSRGAFVTKKQKTKKPGVVEKIIRHPAQPEKVQISLIGGDDLYKEIRIENKLETEDGEKAKLKQGAHVDVIVEADVKDTVSTKEDEVSSD